METALKVILAILVAIAVFLLGVFVVLPVLAWLSAWVSMNIVVALFHPLLPALSSLTFESVYALALAGSYLTVALQTVIAALQLTVED